MTGLARAAVSLAQIVAPADGEWGDNEGAAGGSEAGQRYSMDAYRGSTGRVAGIGAARVAREVDGLVRAQATIWAWVVGASLVRVV